tara:strand:- start:9061 stop:9408 length:348 start_codon:yes stop_codon:yes gene_type:complete
MKQNNVKNVLKTMALVIVICYIVKELNKTEAFASFSDSSIIFYGRMSCPYCRDMKKFLDSNNFPYDYRNTEKEPAKTEYKEKGANGVPFFVNKVNGKTCSGYLPDMEKFKSKLGI